jgi:hypothetical protein
MNQLLTRWTGWRQIFIVVPQTIVLSTRPGNVPDVWIQLIYIPCPTLRVTSRSCALLFMWSRWPGRGPFTTLPRRRLGFMVRSHGDALNAKMAIREEIERDIERQRV